MRFIRAIASASSVDYDAENDSVTLTWENSENEFVSVTIDYAGDRLHYYIKLTGGGGIELQTTLNNEVAANKVEAAIESLLQHE
jgi:hypothetical protein